MTDKVKIRIVVDEDAAVVAQIDAIADAESISRSDVMRRAIRRLLISLSTVPGSGNNPKSDQQVAA